MGGNIWECKVKPGRVLSLPCLSWVLELAAFSLLAVIVITSGSGWLVSLRTLRLRNFSLWSFQSFNNLQTIETFTLFQFICHHFPSWSSYNLLIDCLCYRTKVSLSFPYNKLVANFEIRSLTFINHKINYENSFYSTYWGRYKGYHHPPNLNWSLSFRSNDQT